jgi:hypothetical protein
MKKILFTAFVMLIFQLSNAQELTTPSTAKLTDKELGLQYLKKSKNLKIAGWALLGSGLVLTYVGAATAWNDDSGAGLFYAGTLLTIGSIPCFIAGAKNKGRAEILLRSENVLISYKSKPFKAIPSLTLAIKL